MAASGPHSRSLAADIGDGICIANPEKGFVDNYIQDGGSKENVWAQVVLAWGKSKDQAAKDLYDNFLFSVTGWKVQSELPNPVNFAAATSMIKPEDMAEDAGPQEEKHLAKVQKYLDSGFTNLSIAYPGSDIEGFMTFWNDKLKSNITSS